MGGGGGRGGKGGGGGGVVMRYSETNVMLILFCVRFYILITSNLPLPLQAVQQALPTHKLT